MANAKVAAEKKAAADAKATNAKKLADEKAAVDAKVAAAVDANAPVEKEVVEAVGADQGSSNWYPSPYPTVIIKKLEE